MPAISLDRVRKRFGAVAAVDGITLSLARGGLLAILGPSGCGKTTLLRLLAGLETLDSGEIVINGVQVAAAGHHVPPERRSIGMVFQSYALWPHLSVADNVGYALKRAGLPAAERAAKVQAALTTVAIAELAARRPHELSGGQRQRVALARCLAMSPGLVLLDEPLAALDAHLKSAMQAELARLHQATGTTMVMVTHDQAEAMALATEVAVLDHGRLQQLAPPRELYERPATSMVARFLGRGTVAPADVLSAGAGKATVRLADQEVVMAATRISPGPAEVLVRPEQLQLADTGQPMRVLSRAYLGGSFAVELGAGDLTFRALLPEPPTADVVPVLITGGWVIPIAPPPASEAAAKAEFAAR